VLSEKIAESPLLKPADHSLYRARVAKPSEVRPLTGGVPQFETSLLLGVDTNGRTIRIKPTKGSRELGNMLIDGQTRRGKGLLLTTQLKTWPHSVVVNDIKGDLSDLTAEARAKMGKVFFIDPRGVGHRYDPLQLRTTEDELRSSAEQLLYDPKETQPIFTQRAVKMLTQFFRCARLEGYRPIPYAAHLVHLGPIDAAARLDAISKRANLPPSKNLATRFLDGKFEDTNFADPFFQSSWSTLTTKIDPIITETVIKSIAGSDFSPEELLVGEKPVTVYLRFPELHLHALSPLIRLIWSSLIDELCNTYDGYKRAKKEKQCRPVLLAIDEAGRAPVPGLPEYAATVAGRGISLWVAIQSLSQLDAIYGPTRAKSLKKNMATKIFYRPGDLEAAEHLERELSYTSAFAHSKTTHHGVETSEGETEHKVPLLSAWQIRYELKKTEILAFTDDAPPFRANRMSWLDFPHLQEEFSRATPPVLRPLPDAPEIPPLSEADGQGFPEIIDPDQRN
jgi:type IV secretory pathway TraG/TraD family ATPase VirD4